MGPILVNIGIGTSNAKNAIDQILALHSHDWLMVGHYARLRGS